MEQIHVQEHEVEKPHRRDRGTIVLDILQVLSEKDRRFTHLLYKSNLSCERLKHYLAGLTEKGLVTVQTVKGKVLYTLTDSGRALYLQYRSFSIFLQELHTTANQEVA